MARVEEQVSLPEEMMANNDVSGEGGGGAVGSSSGSTTTMAGSKDLMDLFKPQAGQLPLARIKKVMKASDDQVKVSLPVLRWRYILYAHPHCPLSDDLS